MNIAHQMGLRNGTFRTTTFYRTFNEIVATVLLRKIHDLDHLLENPTWIAYANKYIIHETVYRIRLNTDVLSTHTPEQLRSLVDEVKESYSLSNNMYKILRKYSDPYTVTVFLKNHDFHKLMNDYHISRSRIFKLEDY